MALDWLVARLAQAAAPDLQRRNQRIDAEVHMIAQRYSRPPYTGVHYDDEGRDWLMIPHYALPDRFEERHCNLLIVFPETYPETPPLGFYLDKAVPLRAGRRDPHATGRAFYGAPDLLDKGWHWYCVRMDMSAPGAWNPQPDPRQPDNLWTYLNMVREALSNDS